MSPTVAVAMSGGVDSSVAAALLKEQGCDVIGITLQLWPKGSADRDRHHGCCSLDAVEDARRVAARLDIPYYVLDVQEEFNRRVVDPFLADYEQGRTPNPCISCNTEVKFDLLLRKAREIGAGTLATGHYARIEHGSDGRARLLTAVDPGKDQSYVLYGLSQEELSLARFPLGAWRKADVREKARQLGLVTADKPDSVEICFVTGGDYRDLLAKRSAEVDPGGEIRHLDGTPWGVTVVSGTTPSASAPGSGRCRAESKARSSSSISMPPLRSSPSVRANHWRGSGSRLASSASSPVTRLPTSSTPASAFAMGPRRRRRVRLDGPGRAAVDLDEPVAAAAPGQAAVMYRGEEVLGGGRILRQES